MRTIAKSYWLAVMLLVVWLLAWIAITWPAMMDDALIHLRFADHLWRQHMVSYDGVGRAYGTSSLLYVAILSLLRGLLFTSPALPRAVSSVALLVFFAGLAAGLARRLRNAPASAWLLSLLMLVVIVMPSAIRWLDDGMETAITLTFTMLLVFAAWKSLHRSSARYAVVMAVLGFFTILLRVEMLLLVGIVSATILVVRWERRSTASRPRFKPRVLMESLSPIAGGSLAAVVIMLLMHALLPDTALAKSFGLQAWWGTVNMTVRVFAGSMSFGMGSLLLWLLSWVTVVLVRRRLSLSSIIANSPFPLVILLTVLRGQAVQGVRYFEWAFLFSFLWNIFELADTREDLQPLSRRWIMSGAYALGAILFLSAPIEALLLKQVFRERQSVLAEFEGQNLERISGLRVVAFDVGFAGYFTGAPLCDMAGLVNGREAAMMSYAQRVARCVAWKPQAGFLNRDQTLDLSRQLDMRDWVVCGSYDYSNLRYVDTHYLIAAPQQAREVCAAAHGTPRRLDAMLRLGVW